MRKLARSCLFKIYNTFLAFPVSFLLHCISSHPSLSI